VYLRKKIKSGLLSDRKKHARTFQPFFAAFRLYFEPARNEAADAAEEEEERKWFPNWNGDIVDSSPKSDWSEV
jgi:hypothetical protein